MAKYFISYSSADAYDFALRLADELQAGPPALPVWFDKRDIDPGRDWDTQIAEGIRDCDALIFVMTRDSVEDQSVCKNEWTRALMYRKPIVPILLHREAVMPFRLGSRQYIDFTLSFDQGMARLRRHLGWLTSPEGILQALKDRMADAQRDLRRAPDDAARARINEEIAQLQQQIAGQQRAVDGAATAPSAPSAPQPDNTGAGASQERPAQPPSAGGTPGSASAVPPVNINTGGGTYIAGNVSTGGDFVGRDQSSTVNAGQTPRPAVGSSTTPAAGPAGMALSRELVALLDQWLKLEEIEQLALNLSIDWENLEGEAKRAKARSLAEYCRRRGRLEELREAIYQERPDIPRGQA